MDHENEQGAMAKMTKLEWGVVFSVLASAGSIIFSSGIIWTTVQQNSRDIVELQVSDRGQVDRLARIETKIDVLIDARTKGTR